MEAAIADILLLAVIIICLLAYGVWKHTRSAPPPPPQSLLDVLLDCISKINLDVDKWSPQRKASLDKCFVKIQQINRDQLVDGKLLDSSQLQRLAKRLAFTFFRPCIHDRVEASFTQPSNEREKSEVLLLESGNVAIHIAPVTIQSLHHFEGLSYTTGIVSLLLRELCKAFLLLQAQRLDEEGLLSHDNSLLGASGYGLGWIELAGWVQDCANRRLFMEEFLAEELFFEMKRKARTEFRYSGLKPFQEEQIDVFFDGVNPLLEDNGKKLIRRVVPGKGSKKKR